MKKKEKGFTLIELLAVITILALIAIVTTVSYRGYVENSRRKAYDLTKQSLLASANNYFKENKLDPSTVKNNENIYCISVEDLINAGYHKKESIESLKPPAGRDPINRNTFIKINEKRDTKVINQKVVTHSDLDDCNIQEVEFLVNKSATTKTNKIIQEFTPLDYYQTYECKITSPEVITGTYTNGKCTFNNLTHNTEYTYQITAKVTIDGTLDTKVSNVMTASTKELKAPTLGNFKYSILGEELSVSNLSTFQNTWATDKKFDVDISGPNGNNLDKENARLIITPSNYILYEKNNNTVQNQLIDESTQISLQNINNITLYATVNNTSTIVLSDGTNTVSTSITTDNIDSIKPQITNSTYSNGNVTINYTDNQSKVNKIYYSTSNSTPTSSSNWTSTNTGNATSSSHTFALPEGTTYYVWVMDAVGNISSTYSVTGEIADSQVPNVTYTISPQSGTSCYYDNYYNCWTANSKKVSITFTDDKGLDSYEIYYTDESGTVTFSSDTFTGNPLSKTIDFTMPNRVYTIYVIDKVGNMKFINISNLFIDNTPPIIDSTFNTTCTSSNYNVQASMTAVDSETGVAGKYYNVTSSNSEPYVNSSNWKTSLNSFTFNRDEVHYIWGKAVDNVGNFTIEMLGGEICYSDVDEPTPPPVTPDPPVDNPPSDCKLACYMTKYMDEWFRANATAEQKETAHASNSIIAGRLSFKATMSFDAPTGVWYKGSESLTTWYNRVCRSTTTCGNTVYGLMDSTRKQNTIRVSTSTCAAANSSYVSGKGNRCCNIGTGYYNGYCYLDSSTNDAYY